MHELEQWPQTKSGYPKGGPLDFAVFALTHAACEDVRERRTGEGCLIGWCFSCAELRTFDCSENPGASRMP